MQMGVRYFGLGSLVPFFNKNHDLKFVGKVIMDAREAVGKSTRFMFMGPVILWRFLFWFTLEQIYLIHLHMPIMPIQNFI